MSSQDRGRDVPRVEKVRIPVRLAQHGREPREGWLLLYPPDQYNRPETTLEMLNAPRNIIPFIEADGSSVLLLTRANIEWVAIGLDVESQFVVPPDRTVNVEQRVEVHFSDHSKIEGKIKWNATKDSPRLSDFLNASDDFFVMETAVGALVVNRQRVRETRVAGSPTPLGVAPAHAG
jgi:hypothetical protein